MSITGPILAPVTQPAGLYPASPPRIKKPSKGSKINRQKKGKFAKRPELPPISYHVTPYENPDNPPEYKREGGRFYKIENRRFEMPFKNLPDKANSIYEDAYNSYKKKGYSDKRAAKAAWGAVKQAGFVKKGDKWVKGSAATESRQGLFKKEKADHPDLSDEQIWKIVDSHVKPGNRNPEKALEGQTPHEQDHLGPMQPHEPIMRMTTPDDTPEQRPGDYKSPFPGRNYSPNFPDRNPGHSDTNPADLTLEELRQREKKTHPDMDDKEIDELVKLHIRELGPPSDKEHKEDYNRAHPQASVNTGISKRIHFGLDDGIPFFNRFKVGDPTSEGDIPLTGTFLDYNPTTNGWRIDPNEEPNLVADQGKVTFRVAHSKEPERVIGQYKKFWAAEDDGCVDAKGNPLGRHIDFLAETNPQDPQLRVNIMKGWVNDISPGLDAELFCEECNEQWGLDQTTNKIVKTCDHQDAIGLLRHIIKKEGSMVTEPAFEGRTQFRPTFTMAVNKLFSPDEYESEPLASRLKGHASHDGRQTKGGNKIMSNNSERKEGTDAKTIASRLYGFFTASEAKKLDKMHFWKAEDEDEDKGEDEDEDARIRAAMPLIKKAMKRAEDYTKMLKQIQPGEDEDRMEDEDQHKYAEDTSEDKDRAEDEDDIPEQKGVPSPGEETRSKHPGKVPINYEDQQPTGPGQLKGMNLSDEERRTVARAEKIILDDKKAEVLGHANIVLARQEKRRMLAELERARKLFEAQKDTNGVKAADEQIQKLKTELQPQVATNVQGAQVPGANPTILTAEKYGSTQIVIGPHGEKLEVKAAAARPTVNAESFAATFNASLLPALKAAPRLATVSEQAWDRQTRRVQ